MRMLYLIFSIIVILICWSVTILFEMGNLSSLMFISMGYSLFLLVIVDNKNNYRKIEMKNYWKKFGGG